jgi:hypothetical protein
MNNECLTWFYKKFVFKYQLWSFIAFPLVAGLRRNHFIVPKFSSPDFLKRNIFR